MKLPQIRIETQMAKIALQQQPGKQEIKQPKADVSIQQPRAELTITRTPSKLQIDQTKAWEDMNLMSILRRNDIVAAEGKQGALEGTGRRAQQGQELMKIENKGNPIINQAIVNGHKAQKPIGIDFIPSRFAVKIDFQPGMLDIDVTPHKPQIEIMPRKVEHRYENGEVDISMKQQAALSIDFVHASVDNK
ncbi:MULTISPECIES: DUF6470 family protein [unclassified Virgibacillus]|uniref:DUF6470 family protein n=1 Tax=unclassified Virgibacillus TaxID=2620237 RepID=UPI0024DE57F9|nr:DUF6470 family protein [Virgibacillus sp. LDC-1]